MGQKGTRAAWHVAARPATIGLLNDRLVLDHLLAHGSCTRAQLRSATGMAQPTISSVLERLRGRGLVTADGIQESHGVRGPAAELFRIDSAKAYVASVRLSPSRARVAIFDLSGQQCAAQDMDLHAPASPAPEVAELLDAVIKTVKVAPDQLARTIVGVPGPVHPSTGEALLVDGRPTWGHQVKSELEKELNQPLWLENQLNLAGIAEHRIGAGRQHSSMCLLSAGPGVGLAMILSGKLWTGASGGAGEIAGLPIPGRPAEELHAALGRNGDVDALADLLARTATAIVGLVDPGLIVLTGDLIREHDPDAVLALVSERYRELSRWDVTFAVSEIEGDAVLRGGSLLALDDVRNELWGVLPASVN